MTKVQYMLVEHQRVENDCTAAADIFLQYPFSVFEWKWAMC